MNSGSVDKEDSKCIKCHKSLLCEWNVNAEQTLQNPLKKEEKKCRDNKFGKVVSGMIVWNSQTNKWQTK